MPLHSGCAVSKLSLKMMVSEGLATERSPVISCRELETHSKHLTFFQSILKEQFTPKRKF